LQNLMDMYPMEDVSLSQFFDETQITASARKASALEKSESGLSQFFTATANSDDVAPSNERGAHGIMDALRQKAGEGTTHLNGDSIGFPKTFNLDESPESPSGINESPVVRRILKRRKNKHKKSRHIDETSPEFLESRKEFIEEQAEESEDDYAAWRSGDESENDATDGVVSGLIDDETKINLKGAEREAARLYMYIPLYSLCSR
jgi:hypothetical protein